MKYGVSILRRAQKELANLPSEAFERVRDALRSLADDPRPIEVVQIGHRRDVYR